MLSKTILTDLRLGLAAVLAAQSVVVDTLTNLGVPGKVISSALGVIGLVAAIVQVISDNQPVAIPTAPVLVPAPGETSGNVKPS